MADTEELGLFALGIVLLPTERVPLHVFEPRYRELIGESLEAEREFGLILGSDAGVAEIGTRAHIVEVLEELPDGRLNVLIEGGERFRVVELIEGRSFRTAAVEAVEDEADASPAEATEKALSRYRKLAEMAGAEPDEPDAESPILSFELAARVEFGAEEKQELLGMRSEPERLTRVTRLLEQAAVAVELRKEVGERASRNGRVSHS